MRKGKVEGRVCDPDILVSDFAVVAAVAATRARHPELPVIYAGWSMGAVQAVAASGDLDWRSPRLVGLVLMSMDQRGRYGLRLPEQIGLEPDGEGTFGVADFTAAVANLRVAQMSAVADLEIFMGSSEDPTMPSVAWIW